MTFEALQIANKEISTIDVKGKQYAEVNQRIKVFRMLFPNGSITTKIESLQDGMCVMSAEVRDEFSRRYWREMWLLLWHFGGV